MSRDPVGADVEGEQSGLVDPPAPLECWIFATEARIRRMDSPSTDEFLSSLSSEVFVRALVHACFAVLRLYAVSLVIIRALEVILHFRDRCVTQRTA